MIIFVGNLNTHTTEKELLSIFTPYGQVTSVEIVKDNYTKRSRGFANVEMAERMEGERAIEKLNNTILQTRSIVVNEAKTRNNVFRNKLS